MTSLSIDSVINSSIDGINTLLANLTVLTTNFIGLLVSAESLESYWEGVLSLFANLSHILYFDDFQLKLFRGFLIFLFVNIFLIYVSWRVYGKRICDRFMKPATSKAIEELKASVSKLKLPKEHSPRI